MKRTGFRRFEWGAVSLNSGAWGEGEAGAKGRIKAAAEPWAAPQVRPAAAFNQKRMLPERSPLGLLLVR